MKVLYLVTAFPREPGDVITPWLTETIDRLRARDIEVEVLAPSYRGLGDQVIGGTRVHRFRYAPRAVETLTHDQTAPDRVRERPRYLALVPGYVAAGTLAAMRLARSGRFDLAHAFWPLPHGLFGLAARGAGGIPLVSTFFGVELTWVRSQLPFLGPLVRAIVRRSDAVTAISGHTAAEVRRLAPDATVRIVPFGAAVGPRAEADAPRPPSGAPFGLLFAGRLVERKGVAVLLHALARLRDEPGAPDARLVVVGDGPLAPALRAEADALGLGGRVEFTGFVSAEELSRRFAEADAFVLPAVQDAKGDVEGLGVVLIEALLHARPVIATASGGITDIVLDGETGLLVPPGDPAALADAIRRLASEPGLAVRLVERGRAHVRARFSWDAIIDALAALYGEVLARRGAPPAGRR